MIKAVYVLHYELERTQNKHSYNPAIITCVIHRSIMYNSFSHSGYPFSMIDYRKAYT